MSCLAYPEPFPSSLLSPHPFLQFLVSSSGLELGIGSGRASQVPELTVMLGLSSKHTLWRGILLCEEVIPLRKVDVSRVGEETHSERL